VRGACHVICNAVRFLQRGRIACNAERGIATAIPSVRLSVRPSVTRWYPIQTNEDRIMRSSLWGRKKHSSFLIPTMVGGDVPFHLKFALKMTHPPSEKRRLRPIFAYAGGWPASESWPAPGVGILGNVISRPNRPTSHSHTETTGISLAWDISTCWQATRQRVNLWPENDNSQCTHASVALRVGRWVITWQSSTATLNYRHLQLACEHLVENVYAAAVVHGLCGLLKEGGSLWG